MKTRSSLFFKTFLNRMLLAAILLAVNSAMGANWYFNITNAPTATGAPGGGTNYDLSGNFWASNSEASSPPYPFNINSNMVIGVNASDFNGSNYTINLDVSSNWANGITINSTNTVITMVGTNNIRVSAAATWSVAQGSTLIMANSANNNGFNFNNQVVTLSGAGTINFSNAYAANGNANQVINMTNGTVLLNQVTTGNYGATAGAGLTLTAGTLVFGNATALADAFANFTNGNVFAINGGAIDNKSGSAGTLGLGGNFNFAAIPGSGLATYRLGGNFTFVGSSSLNMGTNSVALTATPTITVNANTLTFAGPLSSTNQGVTVAGSGTLALTAANTYAGDTTITGGTLSLGASGSLSNTTVIAVSSGGTFDVSGLASPFVLNAAQIGQTLQGGGTVKGNISAANSGVINVGTNTLSFLNNVTFSGGSTNSYTLSTSPSGPNGAIAISGPATFTGQTTIFINYTYLTPGTYTLMTYSSASPGNPVENGNLVLANIFSSARGQTVVLNDSTPGVLKLVVTGTVGLLNWVGDGVANNWDIQTTANWFNQNSSSSDVFYQGDVVTFSDSGSATPPVNIAATVLPKELAVTNNAKSYTFAGSGSLGNLGSPAVCTLTKQGSGSLVLTESGGDNWNGGTVVNGGTLILSNTATVSIGTGIGGGLTVNAGSATLAYNGNFYGGITANGGSTLMDQPGTSTANGGIFIGTNALLLIGNNDANGVLDPSAGITNNGGLIIDRNDVNFSPGGIISGTGSLTNNGTGMVTITNNNETMSGSVVCNNGILAIGLAGLANGSLVFQHITNMVINGPGTIVANGDNEISGTTQTYPTFINAGGTLTGTNLAHGGAGTSGHIKGVLTLNGGTLAMQGTEVQPANGTWDLDGGVTVGNPPSPVTSLMSAYNMALSSSPTNVYAITNGSTPSGIDLLVTGTFIHTTSQGDRILIKTGNGTMAFDNPSNTYSGGTIVSNGFVQLGAASDTAPLAGSLLGTGPVVIGPSGFLSFGSSQAVTLTNIISGPGSVVANNGTAILSSVEAYSGSTFINNGSTLQLVGTATINNSTNIAVNGSTYNIQTSATCTNASLSLTNATIAVSVTAAGVTNGAVDQVVTNLNLGGAANTINIPSLPQSIITGYPIRMHIIRYSSINAVATNIVLGTLPPSNPAFVGFLTTTNGFIDLVLTSGQNPVRGLTWLGTVGGSPAPWDVDTSLNWQTNAVTTLYDQFDGVTFNDSLPGQTNVNVTTVVTPGSIVISNTVKEYVFTGSGSISNTFGSPFTLIKTGTNALIMDVNNNYNGGTVISNGIVQIGAGNGIGASALGIGPVMNNGALVFNVGQTITNNNNISGTGSLTEQDGQTLRVAGFNTFNGAVLVANNSTLQLGSSNSLGTNNPVTITSGSTLDLFGHAALNNNRILASGTGNSSSGLAAIDISATNDVFPALTNITLLGDTSIGASGSAIARWDLRALGGDTVTSNSPFASLSTGGQPYNLTKVGPGFIGIVSVAVDPALANIDVQNGTLDYEGASTSLGNPADTLTIEGNSFAGGTLGTFQLFRATNQLNKVIVLNDGGTIWNNSGNNIIVGPIDVTNSSGAGFDCNFDISSGSLLLAGPIYGNGVLYQTTGTNTLILSGNNTNFAGGVEVNKGTMIVSNLLDAAQGVMVDFGTTLNVQGTIGGGGVTNNAGGTTGGLIIGSGVISNVLDNFGTLYPSGGGAPATLTVNGNLVLEFSAGNNIDVTLNNTNIIGNGVNDLIAVNGNVTGAGGSVTINVNPIGLLTDGKAYTIVTYTGSLNLNGTTFTVTPVDGYTFTVSTATAGQINIVASGGPQVWNGGSTTDSDWSDAANWNGAPLAPNFLLFFAGNNRTVNTNDTAAGTAYNNIEFAPGASAFVVSGNPIQLNGKSIVNDAFAPETFEVPASFNTLQTFNGNSNTLIIGGGLTNTLQGAFNGLVLEGSGILTNLLYSVGSGTASAATNELFITGSNANWNLVDNPTHTPISAPWSLEISNGTFVVGNAGSAPNFTSLTAQGGPTDNQLGYIAGQGPATLIISNGTFTTSARMNTGPTAGSTGIVDVVGGTLTVAAQFQGANGSAAAGSQLNVSGGSFSTPGTLFVSSRGVGFLNISGTGTVTCATVDVSRNANSGGSGLVNLNGGTLNAGLVSTETANNSGTGTPYAQFNFNGGTLAATAGSATFFQGSVGPPVNPINTYVLAGGAIINDGGNAITFLEELQHTNGVAVDGGLTKLGTGTVTLAKTNTYNGPTAITAGTLALGGSGTNYATPIYIIASGATLNVAGLATVPMALQPNQTISNTAPTATIVGSLATGSGKLALTYAAGSPSLTVNGGTLTLSAGTGLTIRNTGAALAPGTYSIISTGTGGVLVGTPSSFTVTGGGVQAGLNTSLVNTGSSLNLVVASPTPPVITGISVSGVTLTITATNGTAGGPYTLLESTNLLLPLNHWTPVFTNSFNGSGNINLSTNVVNPANAQMFYLLQMP